MEQLEDRLARWQRAGLITRSQAESIRAYERSRPRHRAPEPPGPRPTYVAPAPLPRPGAGPPARPPGDGAGSSGRGQQSPERPVQPFAPLVRDDGGPLLGGLPWAPPDARVVGLAMALLALVGAVVGVFWVTLDLLIAPTHNVGGDLEDVLHLGASMLGVVGGLRMAMGAASGRRLVLASLGINLVATAVLSLHRLAQAGTLFEVLLWIALGVIVAASAYDRSARPAQG